MWCSTCKRDVPGISSQETPGTLCCARCGRAASANGDDKPAEADDTSTDPQVSDWLDEDVSYWNNQPASDLPYEWELRDDVYASQRLQRNLCSGWQTGSTAHAHNPAATPWSTTHSTPQAATPLITAPAADRVTERATKFVSWSFVYLGLIALICGAALTAWAYLAGRGELWVVGIPTAVLGQIGLVFGLILQLDGLWHSHQRSSQSFALLDHRISDLRQTTIMLNPPHLQAYPAPHYPPFSGGNMPGTNVPVDLRHEIERQSARVVSGK